MIDDGLGLVLTALYWLVYYSLKRSGRGSLPVSQAAIKLEAPEQYLQRVAQYRVGDRFQREAGKCSIFCKWRKGSPMIEYNYAETRPWLEVRYAVTQKFWLRLVPETVGLPADREINVGEERIDSRFIIHADQPQLAKMFLTKPAVVDAVTHLDKVDRFEIYRGHMKAIVLDPELQSLKARDVEWIFEVLAKLKALYEAEPLPMRMLHTFSSKTVCPFCRENLRREERKIVTCSHCGVQHHQECWRENRRCTTWGCQSNEFST